MNLEQIIAGQKKEYQEMIAPLTESTADIWNWHSSSIKEILEEVKLKISGNLCNLLNLYSIEDLDNEIARNTDERIRYVAVFGRDTINYLESIIKKL